MDPELASMPIVDAHIHFPHPDLAESLIQVLDAQHIDKFNIVCTPHRTRLSLIPDALYLKSLYPERTYVFGGLDISPLFIAPDSCGMLFAGYLDTLQAMGCDGVKMIEGKPDMRKTLPIPPFDSPAYAPYWEQLENSRLPLIFHVNDPEEFWDEKRIPGWAREQGWFYGDGTYVNNEQQYQEVLNVLERHPNLKVIFAHFFFLSAQLPRLAEILDRFPNVCVDLTPGIEMYHNFSRDPQATRDFFLKYQDRILYGTDIGAKALLATPGTGIEMDESTARIQIVRRFLELEGEFKLENADGFLFGKFAGSFQGIALPADVLEAIYRRNFERLTGSVPNHPNRQAIEAECDRLAMTIERMAPTQPDLPMDTTIAKMVSKHFAF